MCLKLRPVRPSLVIVGLAVVGFLLSSCVAGEVCTALFQPPWHRCTVTILGVGHVRLRYCGLIGGNCTPAARRTRAPNDIFQVRGEAPRRWNSEEPLLAFSTKLQTITYGCHHLFGPATAISYRKIPQYPLLPSILAPGSRLHSRVEHWRR